MIKKDFAELIIFILIFQFFLYTPSFSQGTDGKNLLIITLDTTRADHLGCYNKNVNFTPNIDKLAEDGVMFSNCYSSIPLTLPSHSSIFTGKSPVALNVRNNGRYYLNSRHTTLAELFKKKGYYTFAVISSYVLISKFGLAQGFSYFDDSLDATGSMTDFKSEISAGMVYNKFRLFAGNLKRRNFFGWVHLYDPHIPYTPPKRFLKRFSNDPYSGEIAYVDEIIGKIILELKKLGIFRDTIIIIAGDHGEDKGEHKELGHGIFCYDVSLKVPLIISNYSKFGRGKKIDGRVSLLDIFPTLSEMYGFRKVKDVEGVNLAGFINKGSVDLERDIFFESMHGKEEMGWAPLTGLINGNYKYISLPKAELYDLSSDPGERRNLFIKKKELSGKFDRKLESFYKKKSSNKISGKRKLSKKDINHLATLGYISSFKKSKRAIDPKDGIEYIDKLRKVQFNIDKGKITEAEKMLKKLFFSPKRIKTIHAFKLFDLIYRRKGDLKNLIKYQELALKEFPKNENIKILLAKSYFNSFKFKDSERICKDILKTNQKNTQALIQLGKIYLNLKQFEKSINTFTIASGLEPKNTGIKKDLAIVYLKAGMKNEALKVLNLIISDKLIFKNPDNIKLFADISNLYVRAGDKMRAKSMLLDIWKGMGGNFELATVIGKFFFRLRFPGKAENYFKKAIALNRKYSPAHSALGTLYLAMSGNGKNKTKLKLAYEEFKKAVNLDKFNPEALNGRGYSYIFMGDFKNAVIDLERALQLNPSLIDTYFNLGIIYIRLGERSKANKLFSKCKKLFYRQLNYNQQRRLDRLINETL